MPKRAIEVFTHPLGLLAYFATFAIVASIWLAHNRLFAYFFVRSRLFVSLNFFMLAFMLLLTYMLQVFLHFGTGGQDYSAAIGYFACVVIVYLLLAVLYTLGSRARWGELDAAKRRIGVRLAIRMSSISLGMIAGIALAAAGTIPWVYAPFAIFPAALAGRLVVRSVLPKIS